MIPRQPLFNSYNGQREKCKRREERKERLWKIMHNMREGKKTSSLSFFASSLSLPAEKPSLAQQPPFPPSLLPRSRPWCNPPTLAPSLGWVLVIILGDPHSSPRSPPPRVSESTAARGTSHLHNTI